MQAEFFAEWLQRQGYHVIRTASSYWFNQGPRVYQAFPYHWIITPSQEELGQLLHENKAIGLRYSTPIDSVPGAISYHVVYVDQEYTFNKMAKKARYDVRKGSKKFTVEPVSFERLTTEGWQSRADTLVRQGRVGVESQQYWENLCRSAVGLSGFETWAAIADGEMAASLVAFTCDNCCSILYQQSRTQYLSKGVNNVLTYVFTNEVLQRSGSPWVFYGLHSLDAPASVDQFKFRMAYTAKPVRQRVVFHPFLRPAFNRASYAFIRKMAGWKPGNTLLAKGKGMMRFYLEGKRPLAEQTWPPPLLKRKEEILTSQ